jgi:hypothetical protein
MTPENHGNTSEREFQHLTVEAVKSRINKITAEIEELDKTESENNYEMFDPTERAGLFGRTDITTQEYFDNEIRNLKAGVDIITDITTKKGMSIEVSALSMKINKVFRPEDFIIEYIDIIGHLLENISHISHVPNQSEYVSILLTQTEKMVSVLNLSIKTRNIKIDEEVQEEIMGINKLLMHHQIPEIITTRD